MLGSKDSAKGTQVSSPVANNRRVSLARALVIEPRVLLLDEPLASLDANLRIQLRFYIRNLQQQLGVTTLFVTHDQEEALAVADRLVLMRGGQIVEIAPGEDLYRSPRSIFAMTFMGEANLLQGTVSATGDPGGHLRVSTPLGEIVCAGREGLMLEVGDRAWVGIRPDDILLTPDAEVKGDSGQRSRFDAVASAMTSTRGVTGEVRTSIFLGAWSRFEVAVEDVIVQARIPTGTGTRLKSGSRVIVGVLDGAARILEED